MKTTLNLGKIDYYQTGRKLNLVTIDIELTKKVIGETIDHQKLPNTEGYVLSISGNIWNSRKTDVCSGGQNIDKINEIFKKNILVYRLHWLWKHYHLNDMRPNCIHQRTGSFHDEEIMSQVCKHTGYLYGSKWLFEVIPPDIVLEVQTIITANNANKK